MRRSRGVERRPQAGARPDDAVLDDIHARYAHTHDPALRARLVECYVPFAYRIASRFRDRGEPLDDLRQVALTALVLALDRFDPDRGIRFTTYSGRCISGELKRHFRDHSWAVRVGRSAQERYLELRATVEALHQELGRSPTVPDVAARLGVSEEDVLDAMETGGVRQATSLDAPQPGRDREEPFEVGETDGGFADVERRLLHDQVIRDLLARLAEADRRLVELYFFEGRTQLEIAHDLGASQVSVSRHLARIMTRLRAMAGEAVGV